MFVLHDLLDSLIIYHFKGSLIKNSREASYKLIARKDATRDIAIPFRVLARDSLSHDWWAAYH